MSQKLLILILICVLVQTSLTYDDNNTFSSLDQITMQHYHLNWTIDFNNQVIDAKITLSLLALKSLSIVTLDTWNLTYANEDDQCIYNDGKLINQELQCYKQKKSAVIGDQFILNLFNMQTKTIAKGTQFNVTIKYKITNSSSALQFLPKEQTTSKTQPFLYTVSQPIYARSLAPLMDTPLEKCTWSAEIRAPVEITNVFMSAIKTDHEEHDTFILYHFTMNNPMPTYSMAIVAGNIDEKQLGDRTFVIAEPDIISLALQELKDIDLYLNTVEKYIRMPYPFPYFTVVFMPPSFPFGGSENPLLSLVSPSILSGLGDGDKQGISIILRDIAHNWAGSLITCANWQNLWINEGFAAFIMRKAQQQLFGEDFYKIESYNGNNSLNDDYQRFKNINQSSYASLQPITLSTINPQDSFSSVPQEKGYQFLSVIETVLESDEFMNKYIFEWYWSHPWASLDTNDFETYFRNYVYSYYPNPDVVFKRIDFTQWVDIPYTSPQQDVLDWKFYTPLIHQARFLADQFLVYGGQAQPVGWQQLNGWPTNQIFIFLHWFFENRVKLRSIQSNVRIMYQMDLNYNFSGYQDHEILFRWYRVCIYTNYQPHIFQKIYEFLGQTGRLKYIMPIYSAFVETNQIDIAKNIFNQYQNFYHPVAIIALTELLFPAPSQ